MKRTHIVSFKTIAVIGWLLTTVSCMKENQQDCQAQVTLRFSYTLNPEGKDYFRSEVEDLLLYVFDSSDHLISSRVIEVNEMGSSSEITLPFDAGSYKAVAWGNLSSDHYLVREAVLRTAMGVEILTDANGQVSRIPSDLFHGATVFTTSAGENTPAEISFIRNTNNINVLLDPSPGTRTIAGTDLSVRITSSNGAINFDNNKAATQPTLYRPHYSTTTHEDREYNLAAFKVMQLRQGDDTLLQIYTGGELNSQESLTELLTEHFPQIQTDEDFDLYSNYTFIYQYDARRGIYVVTRIQAGEWTATPGQAGGI